MTKDLFIISCLSWLHVPYRWGGDDPSLGADCSGLVQELLAMVGLDPSGDQTAQALYNHFKSNGKVITAKDFPFGFNTGTLVFYGSSVSKITHVALILEGFSIIEAGGGGSSTTSLSAAQAQNAFVRVRPYNRRKDIVAIIQPNGLPF